MPLHHNLWIRRSEVSIVKYDYLIVGAGLFGAVFAHEMTKD